MPSLNLHHPPTSTEPSDPPYRLLRVEHKLVVEDASATTLVVYDRYELQAKRRCRFFEHRYRWTGAGAEVDPIVEQPHSLHGPLLRSGDTTIFLIAFDRDLGEGDREVVSFRQQFIDRQNLFQPFLGKAVEVPIDHLRLTVALPPTLRQNAQPCLHKVGEAREHMSRPPAFEWNQDLDNGTFSIVSDDPQVGIRYSITWNAPN